MLRAIYSKADARDGVARNSLDLNSGFRGCMKRETIVNRDLHQNYAMRQLEARFSVGSFLLSKSDDSSNL